MDDITEQCTQSSRRLLAKVDWLTVSQRHPAHCFSAVSRPFCAVFPPLFCAVRLPGAETERTGEKWRKMGEIWGRNGRETAVAEWRWGQEHATLDQLRRSYEECETRRAEQELVAQRAIGRVEVLHSELHGKAEALQRLQHALADRTQQCAALREDAERHAPPNPHPRSPPERDLRAEVSACCRAGCARNLCASSLAKCGSS